MADVSNSTQVRNIQLKVLSPTDAGLQPHVLEDKDDTLFFSHICSEIAF